MELTSVLIKPYHTEKSSRIRLGQEKSTIAFIVNRKANKLDIESAFKAIYNVTPEKINVLNRKSQSFRNGTRVPGRTKALKIAYIILPKGVSIALTKAEIEEAAKNNAEAKDQEKTKKESKKSDKEKVEKKSDKKNEESKK